LIKLYQNIVGIEVQLFWDTVK